jgi:hypothetical protein
MVLVRTVMVNLSKLRDVYLHTNCLATLANLAPYLDAVHPFTAYKVVKLYEMLSKKYIKTAINLANEQNENKQFSEPITFESLLAVQKPIEELDASSPDSSNADYFSQLFQVIFFLLFFIDFSSHQS